MLKCRLRDPACGYRNKGRRSCPLGGLSLVRPLCPRPFDGGSRQDPLPAALELGFLPVWRLSVWVRRPRRARGLTPSR